MHFNLNIPRNALLFSFNFIATIPYGAPVIKETDYMSLTELCNTGAHQSSDINRLAMSYQQISQVYNKCLVEMLNKVTGDILYVETIMCTMYMMV